MKDNVKFCSHCNITKDNTILFDDEEVDFYAGYICCMKPETTQDMICPFCKNKLVETNISEDDIDLLGEVSCYDRTFLEAMLELKDTDPIEYQLKLSQFKAQIGQQKVEEQRSSNIPKCPKCGSTSITTGARGVNYFWGFIGASKTVNRCATCGYTWKPNGR